MALCSIQIQSLWKQIFNLDRKLGFAIYSFTIQSQKYLEPNFHKSEVNIDIYMKYFNFEKVGYVETNKNYLNNSCQIRFHDATTDLRRIFIVRFNLLNVIILSTLHTLDHNNRIKTIVFIESLKSDPKNR